MWSAPWDELNVTWRTQPRKLGAVLARLAEVQAERWHPLVLNGHVQRNGVYDFALLGESTYPVSFASRECENFQPELVLKVMP